MNTEVLDFIQKYKKLFFTAFAMLIGIELVIFIGFGIYSIDERNTVVKNSRGEKVYAARGQIAGDTLQEILLSLNTQKVQANLNSVSYNRVKASTTIKNSKGDTIYQCQGKKTGKDIEEVLEALVERGVIGKGPQIAPNKDNKLVIVNTNGETIFEPDSEMTNGELQKVLSFLKEKEALDREYKIIYTDDSCSTIIRDASGKIVYTEEGHLLGKALDRARNRLSFQLLEDEYDIEYSTKEITFPVRSWVAFSIDVPLGIVLFFAFIVKLLYKDDSRRENDQPEGGNTFDSKIGVGKLWYAIDTFSRFNVLAMGITVFVIVFLYWAVPDTLLYLGETGYKVLAEHKWIILVMVLTIICLYIWRANRRDKFDMEQMKCMKEIQIEANRETIRAQTQLALKGVSSVKQIEE